MRGAVLKGPLFEDGFPENLLSRNPKLVMLRAIALGLLALATLAGCRPISRDFHICSGDTRRKTYVGVLVDERWCEKPDGTRHGLYTSWHVAGAKGKFREGFFSEGLADGLWTIRDNAGRKREEQSYRRGVKHGRWTAWHQNGQKWQEGEYDRDLKQGIWTYWDRQGKVIQKIRHARGAVEEILEGDQWKKAGPPRFRNPEGWEEAYTTRNYPARGIRSLSGIRWSFLADNVRAAFVAGDVLFIAASDEPIAKTTAERAVEKNLGRVLAMDLHSGREIWSRELAVRPSSPAVYGDVLYFTAGEDLYALAAASGQILWKVPAKATMAFSTPVHANGIVYFGTHDFQANHGLLNAVSTKTRKVLWSYAVLKGYINSSPVVSGDLVLINVGDLGLHALHRLSGKPRWRFPAKNYSNTAVAVAGDTVYYGSTDSYLYALDRKMGRIKWKFRTNSSIFASPAVAGQTVFVASNRALLYALHSQTGQEKWHFQTQGHIQDPPVVTGDVVYLYSTDGNLYALDARTGKELWRFRPQEPWGGVPIPGDGLVFFAGGDRYLYALE